MTAQAAGPIKVKPFTGSMMLAQISGVPLTLCLLNEKHEELHSPVMCKDYIQDPWWSETHKQAVEIYGFVWKPGRLDLDAATYDMALTFGSAGLAGKASNILALLHAWEDRLGFPKSEMLSTNKATQFVLRFSRDWTLQPIRISLLTLMIRVGNDYEGQAVGSYLDQTSSSKSKLLFPPDAVMVKSGQGRMKSIWESRTFPAQSYKSIPNISNCHNATGVVFYRDGTFA